MSNIRSILKNKKPLISVGTHQTVLEAVEKMAENDIGAVLVLDGLGRVAGIFYGARQFAESDATLP